MLDYFRKNQITTLTAITILGALYLVWFYKIDGIYMNKPLILHHDPMSIPLEKNVYKEGEMVRMKVSFCKTRSASSVTQWSLVDGRVTFFPTISRELPVGCYPRNEKDTVFLDLHAVPVGEYKSGERLYFEGANTLTLTGGREVRYNYRTESFTIEKP